MRDLPQELRGQQKKLSNQDNYLMQCFTNQIIQKFHDEQMITGAMTTVLSMLTERFP